MRTIPIVALNASALYCTATLVALTVYVRHQAIGVHRFLKQNVIKKPTILGSARSRSDISIVTAASCQLKCSDSQACAEDGALS